MRVIAKISEETVKLNGEQKCQYKYKSEEFKGDQCPYQAEFYNEDYDKEEGGKIPVCYWHEEKDGKDVINEEGNYFEYYDLREAYLVGANLRGGDFLAANLQGARLESVDLNDAEMSEVNLKDSSLTNACIKNARLSMADISGAYLINTDLQDSYLLMANLRGAYFMLTKLQNINLSHTNLQEADFTEAKLKLVDLRGADLRNSKFYDSTLLEDVDFFQCRLENSTLKFAEKNLDRICINEVEKRYEEAKEVYRNLKNYFRQEGLYDESGQFYYREKLMDKKLYSQNKRWIKWIINNIFRYLAGYGEHPLWVLIWWGIIIAIFGSVFWITGGVVRDGDPIIWYENYYFSVVTFTTLGFGDLQPQSNMPLVQICAMIEAVTGAFMMALFVLTFGRKMLR